MILGLDTVKNITCGAETVREINGEFVFERFTDEQLQVYREYRTQEMLDRAKTSAGIRLSFETDSDNFEFIFSHNSEFSLGMAYVEVHVNGELKEFFVLDAKAKNLKAHVELPSGTNAIDLYLPYKKAVSLRDVTLDDGASVKPVKRSRTMLIFGDSITHGINCQLSSNTYATRIAKLLDADACNKAVSGERFIPELLVPEEPIVPDIVTVAYGTNDWSLHSRATIERRSGDFIRTISAKFPSAKIFIISPIWRAKNFDATKFDGPTEGIHEVIAENAKGLENITVIKGRDLVPADPTLFADGLHPVETGMAVYANTLYEEIKKYI